MKLEDQVCSLDLAKRLKELGVKQESIFSWFVPYAAPENAEVGRFELVSDHAKTIMDISSAFTVAELGEIIQKALPDKVFHWWWSEQVEIRSQYVGLGPRHGGTVEHTAHASTEADARARLLVYLIEQGLVKAGNK